MQINYSWQIYIGYLQLHSPLRHSAFSAVERQKYLSAFLATCLYDSYWDISSNADRLNGSVMSPDFAELRNTASRLAAKGKGLLASDESIGTIGKRLEKAGIANTEVPTNGHWPLRASTSFDTQRTLL